MFEKYEIDNLFYCKVEDIIPYGITNFGGCISIESSEPLVYETIVYFKNGKFYDINHLERVMNIIKCPQNYMPLTSNDHHLYVIEEDTLVPYREKTFTEKNILQRLPFGRKRYL